MQKPQVEHIDGLSPAIAIEQKHTGHTPRSTVGTVTEIYDYLRILFARLGQPHCPDCDIPIGTQTADEIVDKLLERAGRHEALPDGPGRSRRSASKYETLWDELRGAGYVRVRIDGETHSLDQPPHDRSPPQAPGRSRDRPHHRPARRPLAHRRQRSRTRSPWARAWCTSPIPTTTCPSRSWRTEIHSQHLACDSCGRSFEPLDAAQLLVQQLARLVPGLRRAWARRPAPTRPPCCAIRS